MLKKLCENGLWVCVCVCGKNIKIQLHRRCAPAAGQCSLPGGSEEGEVGYPAPPAPPRP